MIKPCSVNDLVFLSTPSARRATTNKQSYGIMQIISIHALCEEGDILWDHFKRFMGEFLSTPSARRATP